MNHNMSLRGLNVMSLQVSSVEVVQAYIDRIQEVNPFVNAVVKDRQETIISVSLMSDSVLLSCSYWLFYWQEDRNKHFPGPAQGMMMWGFFFSLTQKWNKNEDVSIYQPWRMPSDYWDKNMVFNLSSAWCVCCVTSRLLWVNVQR